MNIGFWLGETEAICSAGKISGGTGVGDLEHLEFDFDALRWTYQADKSRVV